MNSTVQPNPYVGARPFGTKEKDFFFGREREAVDLLSLVVSERLVLFYAQSGAGKSSLINTRLIPGLLERGEYKILPVGRLIGEVNQGSGSNNIYIYNLITSLIKQKLDETLISRLTLSQFLAGLDYDNEVGYFYNETLSQQVIESDDDATWKVVLIIDQFEELFTTHQEEWRKREDFFKQVTQAMEDFPNLWIVLVMREDYVAALDPYAYLVRGQFRGRYYMQRLGHKAALEAVQGPAAKQNRPFAAGVAEKLVNDLSSIKVRKPDNTLETQAGQYVEPVQLQVVCSSLWRKLPADVTEITQEYLDQYVGDVNQALGNYYEERVKAIANGETAEKKGVTERAIREWFGKRLITADGIRNMVAQERHGESGGLDDDIVQEFVRRGDLVRAEKRGGGTFYELTHDRLVEPVLENNKEWFDNNLSRLQQRVDLWIQQGHSSDLLLRGIDLRSAMKEAQTLEPTKEMQAFLAASRRSEKARTIAWMATGIALIIMAALSLIAVNRSQIAIANEQVAIANAERAKENEALAIQNRQIAEENAIRAEEAIQAAQEAKNLAEAQRSAARAQIYQTRPGGLYTSTLLAIDSWQRSPSAEAEEILRTNIGLLTLAITQASHSGKINSLEFSPDGTSFVTASVDATACVWNAKDGMNLFCAGSPEGVNDATFSPDGRFIVTGDNSGLVQLLDAKTGNLENQFQYDSPIEELYIRADGRLLAVARQDGKISLVNLGDRQESFRLQHSGIPSATAFSPNGTWLAVGSSEGAVSIWNLNNGNIISGSRHRDGVLAMAFSPNSRLLVTGGKDNTASVFGLASGKELLRIPNEDWIRDVAFSPDGSWFVTVSDDQRIRVWDTVVGEERLRMLQDSVVTEVQVSSNGQWIATTGSDETVRVWNADTGLEIFKIPLKASGSVLAFNPNGNYLISGDQSGEINIWDISVLVAPIESMQFNGTVDNVQYSPMGDLIAVSDENRVWLLRPEPSYGLTGRAQRTPALQFKTNVRDLIFSLDSKLIGIATEGNQVAIYDIEKRVLKTLNVSSLIQSIAFSPDSLQLITNDAKGNVQAWNVLNAELSNDIAKPFTQISSLASSHEFLAVGSRDKINVLDVNGDKTLPEIESRGENTLLVFNAEGSWLASSDSTGQINIWRAQNGEFTAVASFVKEQAVSLAFNPQGTVLAVGTARYVYLIDTAIGEEVARISHVDIVNDVSFSPDGNFLVTASSRAIQFWDIAKIPQFRTNDLIPIACSRLNENFDTAQWNALFGDQEYRILCENLPVPE